MTKTYIQKHIGKIIVGACISFFAANPVFADGTFQTWDVNLPNRSIKEIYETKNYIWTGTARGLARYDKGSKKIQVYNSQNGLPDDFVTSIAVDSDDQYVYVGTIGGVAQIDLKNNKILTFTKKNSKLSDNHVNSVYTFHEQLFIATSLGVDIYNQATNQWKAYTAIEGLAGGNVQTLSSHGNNVWAGGGDGISYYDRNEDAWFSFGADNGLNSSLVTSIAVNTDAVWVGTMGGGVSRFDRSSMRFDAYTTEEGLIDDSVQSLADDGKYLWIGTFGGLSRLDKSSLVFTNYDSRKGLSEASVTASMVSGDVLYCGTDGGGVFTLEKSIPQIEFRIDHTGYARKGEIEIYASILSKESIKKLDLNYKLIATADEFDYTNVATVQKWTPVKNINTSKSDDTRLTVIKTNDLQDGKYLFKGEIEDSKGNTNESTGTFIVDNKAPTFDLVFRPPDEGEKSAVVSGSYKELNLKQLDVKIGNKTVIPEINRQTRRFHFNYPLDSTDKINITMEDIGKNSVTVVKDFILDRDPPVLEIDPVDISKIRSNVVAITGRVKDANMDRVVVLPDNVEAILKPVGGEAYTFIAKASIKKEGKYAYQITASDKMSNTTIKTLEIDFVSKITIVDLRKDLIPEFTLKDTFELSGNILGPPLKEFYLMDKSRDRKYELKTKKDKSFSENIALRDGDNNFSLVKVYDDDRREEDSFKITYSNGKVKASFDPGANSFKEKLVTLRGKFDRGIRKIFLDDKPAAMNFDGKDFTVEVTLKDGKNSMVLSWLDELNRLDKKEYTFFLDNKPPELFVRALADQTSLKSIKVRGSVSDNVAASIGGYPGVEIQKIDPKTGEFEAIVKLETGSNNIYFTSVDPAGNKKETMFHVDVDKSFPESEVKQGALSEEVDFLRNELARLRRELKERPAQGSPAQADISTLRIDLPKYPGLFMVPMAGKIKSYTLTAKVYLGSESLGPILAQYNGKNPLELSRILVPSPQLFGLISASKFRSETEGIIRSFANAYHLQQDVVFIRKMILQYLIRTQMFRETMEINGAVIFLTNNGSGIVISNGVINAQGIKNGSGVSELLVGNVSGAGIGFQRF